MANWAYTNYAIEGPTEVLSKIYDAIMHHEVLPNSDEYWEGNILKALGIKWVDRSQDRENGKYMRGFIREPESIEFNPNEDTVLTFDAEEAWGVTDFNEVLEENLPVKVYYNVEEEGECIYATNDKEGKYFSDRFYVDTAIDNEYDSEYFSTEDAMWHWLNEKIPGLTTKETVEKWNEQHEEACDDDVNFIYIHEFDVVDD